MPLISKIFCHIHAEEYSFDSTTPKRPRLQSPIKKEDKNQKILTFSFLLLKNTKKLKTRLESDVIKAEIWKGVIS